MTDGTGSLGLMANNCAGKLDYTVYSRRGALLMVIVATWPNSPNFLLVDFYNLGSSPGSVFEVAAQQNNVTYSRACCGLVRSMAYSLRPSSPWLMMIVSLGAIILLAL